MITCDYTCGTNQGGHAHLVTSTVTIAAPAPVAAALRCPLRRRFSRAYDRASAATMASASLGRARRARGEIYLYWIRAPARAGRRAAVGPRRPGTPSLAASTSTAEEGGRTPPS